LTLRYKNQVIQVSEDRPTVAMGRADDSDLVVNNHLISRLHARIELQRGKFRLIDESTNGTFVLDSKGEETFVRRDSARIEGEGYIGLGKVAEADSGHAIHYVCTD
ncbi:MAG: FHA domain-containing protein, partial [Gammaproteobacteria bacterium]